MNMYIPVMIVVAANTIYQICAKGVPDSINTFAALSVTYIVAALSAVVLYFITQKNPDLLAEYHHLNWSSFLLGVSIVGLETGFILMYKAGWEVSTAQIVASAFLAVVLIFVGYFLYKEAITARRIIGIAVCLAGLYLINQ